MRVLSTKVGDAALCGAFCALALWCVASPLHAQLTTVRGRVEVVGSGKAHRRPLPETVVWLTPISSATQEPAKAAQGPPANPQLIQKNKSFQPHLLVIPAGTPVEFPNHDPFFHNVFSLFEGKRFDLGLYEAGSSRKVRFDRPGVSYIFCNIHPEMSAVVITLATPMYSIANSGGQLSIAGVPYGRYILHVWSDGMAPESSEPAKREITISENSASLGVIRVPAPTAQTLAHKNKYGRDYDTPTPDNSVYTPQQ